MTDVVWLQIIKKSGFPDWKALAVAIYENGLPDEYGDMKTKQIVTWLGTLGITEDHAIELIWALRGMDMIVPYYAKNKRNIYNDRFRLSPRLKKQR